MWKCIKHYPNVWSLHQKLMISFNYRLGFISQWGALAGRYAALCPPGWPWAHHRMPFHSPTHGKFKQLIIIITFIITT